VPGSGRKPGAGVQPLKRDIVKGGIRERFSQLRRIGRSHRDGYQGSAALFSSAISFVTLTDGLGLAQAPALSADQAASRWPPPPRSRCGRTGRRKGLPIREVGPAAPCRIGRAVPSPARATKKLSDLTPWAGASGHPVARAGNYLDGAGTVTWTQGGLASGGAMGGRTFPSTFECENPSLLANRTEAPGCRPSVLSPARGLYGPHGT
jgi:hypothetical protein